MEIIDEIPPVEQIDSEEFQVYCVLQQKRLTEHSLSVFFVLCFQYKRDEFNKDELKAGITRDDSLILLGLFLKQETTEEFLRFSINLATRNYTTLVSRLADLEPVKERKFLGYIGDDVTSSPGFFEVNRVDYENLRTNFSSVRIATDDEAKTCKFFSSLIPIDYDQMKSFKLSYLKALQIIPKIPVEHHQEICRSFDRAKGDWEKFNQGCIGLAKESKFTRREDVASILSQYSLEDPVVEQQIDETVELYKKILAGEDPETLNGPGMLIKIKSLQGVDQLKLDYC